MPIPYTVHQEGLALDLILWRQYGRRGQDLVSAALALNAGLAALGPTLPLGTEILLPDLPAAAPAATTQPVDLFA